MTAENNMICWRRRRTGFNRRVFSKYGQVGCGGKMKFFLDCIFGKIACDKKLIRVARANLFQFACNDIFKVYGEYHAAGQFKGFWQIACGNYLRGVSYELSGDCHV